MVDSPEGGHSPSPGLNDAGPHRPGQPSTPVVEAGESFPSLPIICPTNVCSNRNQNKHACISTQTAALIWDTVFLFSFSLFQFLVNTLLLQELIQWMIRDHLFVRWWNCICRVNWILVGCFELVLHDSIWTGAWLAAR